MNFLVTKAARIITPRRTFQTNSNHEVVKEGNKKVFSSRFSAPFTRGGDSEQQQTNNPRLAPTWRAHRAQGDPQSWIMTSFIRRLAPTIALHFGAFFLVLIFQRVVLPLGRRIMYSERRVFIPLWASRVRACVCLCVLTNLLLLFLDSTSEFPFGLEARLHFY